MNKKLETKYQTLKDDLKELEKDTYETINSQLFELAKKERLSMMPNLKESLKEEEDYLVEASVLFYNAATKCNETADTIKTQLKEFEKYVIMVL